MVTPWHDLGLPLSFCPGFVAGLLVLLINGLWTGGRKGRITSALVIVTAGYSLVGTIVILFFYLADGLPNLVYTTLRLLLSTYHKFNLLTYGFEFHWPSWQTMHSPSCRYGEQVF